jgi:Membrane protein involved in the export of O-antigen and teichoic acid
MSVLRNTLIVASTSLAGLFIRIASLVVLARTLRPEAFGISAMAMAIIAIVSILVQLDLRDSLIQRARISRRHVRLALMGLCLSAAFWVWLIVMLSPLVERWTGVGGLSPVLSVCAVILAIDALTVIPEALLIRAHQAAIVGQAALAGLALGFTACSIVFSLLGFGVWSLAIGYIAMSALQLAIMTIAAGAKVRRIAVDEMVKPGLGATIADLYRNSVLGSSNRLLNNANDNVGNLVVGALAGSVQLGFYSRAQVLAVVPIETLLGMTIRSIAFPALARLSHDPDGRRAALRQAIGSVSGLVAMIAGAISVLSPELVALLLGREWAPAVFALQCLAAAMMFRFTARLLEALSRAMARLLPLVITNVASVALFLGAIALGTWWRGIDGAALAVLCVVLVQWVAAQALIGYLTDTSLRKMLAIHARPALFAACFLMPLLAVTMLARLLGLPAFAVLAASGAASLIVGLGLLLLIPGRLLNEWQAGIALQLVDRLAQGGPMRRALANWLRWRFSGQ